MDLGVAKFKNLTSISIPKKWDFGEVSAESGLMQRLLVYVSGSMV